VAATVSFHVAANGREIPWTVVNDDPLNPGEQALFVVGTDRRDAIFVDQFSNGTVRVVNRGTGLYETSENGRIYVHTSHGNDMVFVTSRVRKDTSIYGGTGNDLVRGGSGNDSVTGGAGRDILFGARGEDLLDGGSGNDILFGGFGDDILLGGPGNDFLFGQAGDDELKGGDGRDRLFGGLGDDLLDGGWGYDWLYGGPGEDLLENGERNRQ
jgi:Ca2+-binding RTX toxin-like protein